MTTPTLNLARKWRSKTFDTMVGQDLAIKMLKNSLYTNHYFPVYLLAGQRGCGKTSTGRIFAAALNCQALPQFQKDPKNITIPCLSCDSCKALAAGAHPDFIEIDAASHTGVDNVRMIVESSSLLPLMGRKKIYLIDEAHMLSKAAFNAFLKILEEPPMSVIFMLATTDPHKIIDTVRSRCFQLYFKPVESNTLVNHLANICKQEEIIADEPALQLIAKEAHGSVRDAINILEQVRFVAQPIDSQAVYNALGHLDDQRLLQLFELVLHKTPVMIIKTMQEMNLESYSTEFLWRSWVSLLRASIWIKHGVGSSLFASHAQHLQFLMRSVPLSRLLAMLEMLYEHELAFTKTTAAYPFFEMLLLKMASENNTGNSTVPLQAPPPMPSASIDEIEELEEDDNESEDISDEDARKAQWRNFISAVEQLEDPLLLSVFKQGTFMGIDESALTIKIQFPKELSFFQTWFEQAHDTCKRLLKENFSQDLTLIADFAGASNPATQAPKPRALPPVSASQPMQSKSAPTTEKQSFNRFPIKKKQVVAAPREPMITINDPELWKSATLLLKYFPGTLTQVQERA